MSLNFSCSDEVETPDSTLPGEDGQGLFMCTPPELEVSLRSASENVIQENITEQGVSVKISERPWIGNSWEDDAESQLKSTWDDIVWDKDYANIGVFTVKSSDIDAYYSNGKDPIHIECFPFRGEKDNVWLANGIYRLPTGNNSADNPYNYHNANIKVDARTRKISNNFFENSNGEELNFYGYFPYQHQTAGINYTLPATSICKILQANLHQDNLLAMPYTFKATQTKDNIRQHDVMYSVSEDDNTKNRYGNKNKKRHSATQNDNVHMRFVHSFCRLQFKISAGSYHEGSAGAIELSRLSVSGSKVFVDGNLNLIEGIVTPGNASTIYRALDNGQQEGPINETYIDLRKKDLIISMLVQPTGLIETLNDFQIKCTIDGVEYTCSLSPGVELIKNHVYDVNLVLSPETTVKVSSGGRATITLHNTNDYNQPADEIFSDDREISGTYAEWMKVSPNTGWRILKILENGKPMDLTITSGKVEGTPSLLAVKIDRVENETKTYKVICIPENWYAHPENLTIHFDGKLNNSYMNEQKIIPIWRDLTYNGNDGILYNFDLSKYCDNVNDTETLLSGNIVPVDRSGWDKKGLKFDGKDDVMAFPGKITKDEYTISVYICIARAQGTEYHRIISTGNNSSSGFPSMVLNSRSTNLRLFGHGRDELWDTASGSTKNQLYPSETTVGVDIIQIDHVYKRIASPLSGTLTLYVNGEYRHHRTGVTSTTNFSSVDWSALGGRLSDISRQLHGTYYSFMVYNKALTTEEIKQNYNLNVSRYGTKKTDP